MIFKTEATMNFRHHLKQLLNIGALRAMISVALLVNIVIPVKAHAAVCFGESLTTAPSGITTLPAATDVVATEHNGTVRGGLTAETLIDPADPPPQPGSDPSAAGEINTGSTRAAAGTTNIGTTANPRIVGAESVAELTYYANSNHGPASSSPFVDGHLINGDYYGNDYPDDRNFVTLTTKANSDHKGLENKVKSMTARLAQVYHSFGNEQKTFCASTNASGTQVSYKPVIHVRTEVSSQSVKQFEAAVGNPDILFLDLDTSLTTAQQTAIENKITEGMPAWIEMKITLHMQEYQLNTTTNKWQPQNNYSVMPKQVADRLFVPKTDVNGNIIKHNFLGGSAGLSFGDLGGGQKIQYEYVAGVGPQVKGRIYNWGPLKADIIANSQNANSPWPPGITYP